MTKQNLNFSIMAAKNILSNDERMQLIENYKADKLNPPPANIKDETLINNYGTDEQKARLQSAPAAETQKAAENETPAPTVDAGTETGNKAADTIVGEAKEHEAAIQRYKELHGNNPDANLTADEIDALSNTKENEINAAKNQLNVTTSSVSAADNQEYIKAFTAYVDLFHRMPDANLTAEQLNAANVKRAEEVKSQAEDAAQIKKNIKLQGLLGSHDQVVLVNRDSKEKVLMNRFTYDNYMKNQMPEWSIQPEVPAEIKPPVESIGK